MPGAGFELQTFGVTSSDGDFYTMPFHQLEQILCQFQNLVLPKIADSALPKLADLAHSIWCFLFFNR